jgi:hypothetical protein
MNLPQKNDSTLLKGTIKNKTMRTREPVWRPTLTPLAYGSVVTDTSTKVVITIFS